MELRIGNTTYAARPVTADALAISVRMPWKDGKSRMLPGGHYFKGTVDECMTFTLRRSGRWVPKGDPDNENRMRRHIELLNVHACPRCEEVGT